MLHHSESKTKSEKMAAFPENPEAARKEEDGKIKRLHRLQG
jgi:hypothetical protein